MKPMRITLTAFIFLAAVLFTTEASALLSKLDLRKFLTQQETKNYENPTLASTEEYIKAFETGRCSSVWMWVHLDADAKKDLIDSLKRTFQIKAGAIIKKPTEFYVKSLDEIIFSDPKVMDYKLAVLFRTLAILEYDFDEGQDKEDTAKKWLGVSYPLFKEYQRSGE